jgi:hypothetical protein
MDEANTPEGFLSIKRMAGLWPPPLALMAAGRVGPNEWWGECSVFIPRLFGCEPKAYSHLNAGVSGSGLPVEVDMVDADYMRVELEQKAVHLLVNHFSPIAMRTGLRDLYGLRYELLPGAKIDIFHLIENREFVPDIQKLATQTRHALLRDYLLAITKHIMAKIESTPRKPSPLE